MVGSGYDPPSLPALSGMPGCVVLSGLPVLFLVGTVGSIPATDVKIHRTVGRLIVMFEALEVPNNRQCRFGQGCLAVPR